MSIGTDSSTEVRDSTGKIIPPKRDSTGKIIASTPSSKMNKE